VLLCSIYAQSAAAAADAGNSKEFFSLKHISRAAYAGNSCTKRSLSLICFFNLDGIAADNYKNNTLS